MFPRIGLPLAACALALCGLAACSLVVSTTGLAGGTGPSAEGGAPGELDGGPGDSGPTGVDGGPVPQGPALLTGGKAHTCAVVAGRATCWGDNSTGQLGDGTTTRRLTPVAVQGLPGPVTAIGAGYRHTCAIVDGDVWCWGTASSGAIGPGVMRESTRPVHVMLPGRAVEVQGGGDFTCARVADRVHCWGNNDAGRLGDGTVVSHAAPSIVVDAAGLLSGVEQISIGGDHACAMKSGGVPVCWGHSDNGALGNAAAGQMSERAVPVEGLPGPAQLVWIGGWHACAIVSGAPWCWGTGEGGELGNGGNAHSIAPVRVSGLPDSVTLLRVAGGPDDGDATCAVRNGQLSCWGVGNSFRLGDGQTASRSTPYVVTTLPATVSVLAGGDNHWCAQLTTGAVYCWGAGGAGQLGDGAGVDRAIPVAVTGL